MKRQRSRTPARGTFGAAGRHPARWAGLVCWAAFCATDAADAGVAVRLQQDWCYVEAGETYEVRVLLDANDATPVPDALPDGLFSFGVKLTFDSGMAGASAIHVPDELNFLGFDSPAVTAVNDDFAGAKGNVNMTPLTPYYDTLLATVRLTDLAPAGTTYALRLELYQTLGPTEQ